MKKLLLLALVFATPAFAQDPAAPSTTLLAPGGTTATTPAAKPKPLATGDKKFVKDSLDSMFYIMELTGKAKNDAKLESTKQLSNSLKSDLNKVWADVGAIASERNEKIPMELAGSDKSKAERLGKAGEKWDKEYTKIVSKEAEKLAKTFETAQKSGQDPMVKEVAAKWAPTLLDAAKKADEAEKEAAKAK